MTRAQARVWAQEAYERGFSDGFNISGEGWNSEYPFSDKNKEFEDDPDYLRQRDCGWEAMLIYLKAK